MARIILLFLFVASSLLPSHAETRKQLVFWNGSFASAREAAMTLHKPILVHFGTLNPFDLQYDTTVYKDPDVILFTGHSCLPFRLRGDAQDSESVELCTKYHVIDFPTVMLLRSDGTEIDRMVGYQTPKQFLINLQDFLNDTNTVGNLRTRLQHDTANLDLAFQLALRYELRLEVDSALWLMREIVARGVDASPVVQSAKLHLGAFEARALNTTKLLTAFLYATPIDTLRRAAVVELVAYYQRQKMHDSVRTMFDRSIAWWPNDAELLNEYAWYLTQQPAGDMERADTLSAAAVTRDPKEPEFCDTRAEVFRRKHDYKQALIWINKALQLRPNDPTLMERRESILAKMPH